MFVKIDSWNFQYLFDFRFRETLQNLSSYRQPIEKMKIKSVWMSGSTQPVWTLFLFKSIWTRSQGSQGCQKIRFFLQIKLLSFWARIAPKRHKLRKMSWNFVKLHKIKHMLKISAVYLNKQKLLPLKNMSKTIWPE